jgi:glycosyltransferase involved in cell wall biosynthesis
LALNILQIVAYASATGEYGGPTRVADNLTSGLRNLGVDVTLISTTDRLGDRNQVTDSTLRLFKSFPLLKKKRFGTLCSPSMNIWVYKNAAKFDLVHIHIARDLITLPVGLFCRITGIKYVVQPHGMIVPKNNLLYKFFDRVFTRPILNNAKAVYYLSEPEAKGLEKLGIDPALLKQLSNGVPIAEGPIEKSEALHKDVLFLARLAPRKRPMLFLKAAHETLQVHPNVTFSIVGPDEGELIHLEKYVEENGLGHNIRFEGALNPTAVRERMKQSHIYVLPAVDEPFGMTIIESLSVSVPVIVTESAALAPYVQEKDAGLVTPDNQSSILAQGIIKLLEDENTRRQMGNNGRAAVTEDFSIEIIAEELLKSYTEISS